MRPWLVIVTGEPGSGKSTLGRAVAEALRLPYLSRDDVRWGLLASAGLWTDQMSEPGERSVAVESFVQIVERTADLGVSAVLEFMVFRDHPATWARLRAVADCLVIVTRCEDAPGRAERRDREHPLFNRPDVMRALGYSTIDAHLKEGTEQGVAIRAGMITQFHAPTLEVRTDDGYDPPLGQVVDWVVDRTRTDGSSRR